MSQIIHAPHLPVKYLRMIDRILKANNDESKQWTVFLKGQRFSSGETSVTAQFIDLQEYGERTGGHLRGQWTDANIRAAQIGLACRHEMIPMPNSVRMTQREEALDALIKNGYGLEMGVCDNKPYSCLYGPGLKGIHILMANNYENAYRRMVMVGPALAELKR